MPTQDPTTNYSWDLPTEGGDVGAWGGMLRSIIGDDATGIDAIIKGVSNVANAALPKAGGTMTGNLLATDNLYDIGASGATRFRDLWLARNASIGGTLGVTGAVTLSSTLDVTGTSLLGTGAISANTSSGDVVVSNMRDIKSTRTDGATTYSLIRLNNADVVEIARESYATKLWGTVLATGAVTLSSTLAVTGAVSAASTVAVTGRLAPALAAGANNNVSTAAATILAPTTAGAATITGFANGVEGRLLIVRNAGADAITLAFANAGSDATNQIITHTGADIVLGATGSRCAFLVYDGTRWRVVSTSA